MKIAQVIDSLAWGGAQKMQVLLAQAMADRQVELTVISLSDSGNAPFQDEIRSFGARVFHYPAKKIFDLPRLRKITYFLESEEVDLVHAHLTYANIIGTVTAHWSNIPVIATLRTAGIDKKFFNPWRFRIETWLLRHWATRVMANGFAVADAHHLRLKNRNIVVIPNAIQIPERISENLIKEIRQEIVNDPERPLVISVGRLATPKGYEDLISAFALVCKQHPDAYLAIVGSGNREGLLQAQIDELNLSKNVRLIGERGDVPQLLMASDVFVSSSHWEGMSVAVLEAMAIGLPVIATGVGDSPKVVVENTGLIVPPRHPQKMAEVIVNLLNDPDQQTRLGTNARAHIAENYNLDLWGDQIIDLYTDVLAAA